MGKLHRLDDLKGPARRFSSATFFDRTELNLLLSLYSRRVMSGEWRDYAIDLRSGMAVFSVYRHSHDHPLYSIAKRTASGREREYLVFRGPEQLAQSRSLSQALAVFPNALRVVS